MQCSYTSLPQLPSLLQLLHLHLLPQHLLPLPQHLLPLPLQLLAAPVAGYLHCAPS
jgi:hypothetical protein